MAHLQIHNLASPVAELLSDNMVIRDVDEALDILAEASYQGASVLVIRDFHLTPGFFDLSTGIAGEILQKFSTYRCKLAIVGDFSQYNSHALVDFIRECNRGKQIAFLPDTSRAFNWFL